MKNKLEMLRKHLQEKNVSLDTDYFENDTPELLSEKQIDNVAGAGFSAWVAWSKSFGTAIK